jgi:hypothetical protein
VNGSAEGGTGRWARLVSEGRGRRAGDARERAECGSGPVHGPRAG